MSTTLGKDILETLICSLCHKFLSVPPIVSISYDGNEQKCGRCRNIKTDLAIRNIHFEKLAALAKYPCIYRDCEQILNWGEVEHHEEECVHRTIKCPIFWSCNETIIKVSGIISHFKEKHGKQLHYEMFYEESHEVTIYDVFMLVSNDRPYLIYKWITPSSYLFGGFSFCRSGIYNYDLTLCSDKTDKVSLRFRGKTLFFRDEDHCSKCSGGGCQEKSHPTSELYEDIFPFIEEFIQIETDLAKAALDSNVFQCTIAIENVSNSSNNTSLINRVLQCPICEEYMLAPIFTCTTGHSICNVCRPKLEQCPTCKSPYRNSRNFNLEDVAENAELPCRNEDSGCRFKGNVNRLSVHHQICKHKTEPISSGNPNRSTRWRPRRSRQRLPQALIFPEFH